MKKQAMRCQPQNRQHCQRNEHCAKRRVVKCDCCYHPRQRHRTWKFRDTGVSKNAVIMASMLEINQSIYCYMAARRLDYTVRQIIKK